MGLTCRLRCLVSALFLTDNEGVRRLVPLFVSTSEQINYHVPADTATGVATLEAVVDGNVSAVGIVQVARVVPGLFTADASGTGPASGIAVRILPDGESASSPLAQFNEEQGRFIPVPIDLGASAEVYLVLYGTGLRNRSSLYSVTATVGGGDAEVLFAGAHEEFVGLDQVNLKIPDQLAERGTLEVILTVDGVTANPVLIELQ